MTAISVMTVLACLVVGALTIRYGNLTLQRQKAEARNRKAPESVEARHQQALRSYQEAMVQLEKWRRQDLLDMPDDDFEYVANKETLDIEELERLIRFVQINIDQGYVTTEHPMELVAVRDLKEEHTAKTPSRSPEEAKETERFPAHTPRKWRVVATQEFG